MAILTGPVDGEGGSAVGCQSNVVSSALFLCPMVQRSLDYSPKVIRLIDGWDWKLFTNGVVRQLSPML